MPDVFLFLRSRGKPGLCPPAGYRGGVPGVPQRLAPLCVDGFLNSRALQRIVKAFGADVSSQHKDKIRGVIIEPIAAIGVVSNQRKGFSCKGCAEITKRNGTLADCGLS